MILIAIFFFLAYTVLLLYYRHGWTSLPEWKPATGQSYSLPTISVVVPARNEAQNLPLLLEALVQQSLQPNQFEVIVVDDFSSDETSAVVDEFARRHSPWQLRQIQPPVDGGSSSKKKAVAACVAAARFSLIVATDADCLPGPRWLETLALFQAERQACFIAAPVQYQPARGFLEVFQTLDFLTLQGITAASVKLGFHDMCNGANLAYLKNSFMAVNGFAGIDHVASGDDMLLMYKIRGKDPGGVHYLKSRDAIVYTRPVPTWKEFFNQRKRWASKSLVYKDFRIKAVLFLVYGFNCLFPVLGILSFWTPSCLLILVALLLAKTLVELIFLYPVARFYNSLHRLPYFPFFQPFHILYTVFTGLISQVGGYEWKGRKTR